jgi:hypothetical protein
VSIGKPQIKKRDLARDIKILHAGVTTHKHALDVLTSLVSTLARSQGAALGWCTKCSTGAVADSDGACKECGTKIDLLEDTDGV